MVAAPRADVYARIRDAEFFVSCIEGVRDLVSSTIRITRR